jgi:hypothetical protein
LVLLNKRFVLPPPPLHAILHGVAGRIVKHFENRILYLWEMMVLVGHEVAQVVEALSYKPEGRGFDSRWFHWNFSLT